MSISERKKVYLKAISHYAGICIMSLLLILICYGCSRRPQTASVSCMDYVTNYEKEGYKKVLVIHSYYIDYPWVLSITRGIRMVLDSRNVDLQFFYMDTKRNPNKDWLIQQGQNALSIIGQWNPDVVITVDDNAQEYVGKKLVGREDLPVVFCGVNTNPKQYGYPAENVTGVIEKPHFKETVSFLKQVLQTDRTLRILVMSDCSKTTDYAYESMKAEVDSAIEVVDWCKPVTWNEWKAKVNQAQTQADAIAIYVYHTILSNSDNKQSMNSGEVINWTIANSKIPIIGFLPIASEDGSLCGILESGLEQGMLAGQLTMKILDGSRAGGLEIQNSLTTQPMLNLDTARNLGIPVSDEVIRQADILVGKKDIKKSI